MIKKNVKKLENNPEILTHKISRNPLFNTQNSKTTMAESEFQKYERLERLGEGTYGVVYKAIYRPTGQTVAMKKIKVTDEEGISSVTIREIAALKELRHPNIVLLQDVINAAGKFFLVFEFLDQDLKQYMDYVKTPRLDPQLVKSYAYQLTSGIAFCHSRRILHRDLKPQNILIDRDGVLKIGDFGLARAFTIPLRKYTHEVVTLWYRAPEILLGMEVYSTPVDVWSIGTIVAEMLLKTALFPGDSEIDELMKIFQALGTPNNDIFPGVTDLPYYNPAFPRWAPRNFPDLFPGCDPLAIDLLHKMLVHDPAGRISAKAALNHPYFEGLFDA